MAATFVVEDGNGSSSANSYVTIADADTYNDNFVDNTTWDSATDANKEAALRKATHYLDMRFNRRWYGERSNELQALDFPRTGITDYDGYVIDSDEIPQALKDACVEMAVKIAGGETVMADLSDPGTIKSESKKVGPITIKKEYLGGDSPIKKYRKVDALLRDLILPSGEMFRG
jgi:hypothetical protein